MFVDILEKQASPDAAQTTEVVRIIQEHLDKEAHNRRQTLLSPRELCPMQKAEMLQDLASILR